MQKELQEQLKRVLEKEKSTLTKELETFAKEDKSLKNNWDVSRANREKGDMEEEADETQEHETLVSLEHSLELKLKDVNIALEKVEKGGYGACEKCGKEIEKERLLACPEARLCMACNK